MDGATYMSGVGYPYDLIVQDIFYPRKESINQWFYWLLSVKEYPKVCVNLQMFIVYLKYQLLQRAIPKVAWGISLLLQMRLVFL